MHTRFARHLNFIRPDFSDVEPDQRRAVRRAVSLPCVVAMQDGRESAALRMTVLSPFGAWVETARPLAPGAALRLAFTVADAQGMTMDMSLVARVTWTVAPDASEPGGMGLAFDAGDADRARLDSALAAFPPALSTVPTASAEEAVMWTEYPAASASEDAALASSTVAESAVTEAEASTLRDLDIWFLETRPATPTETTEVLRLSPVAPAAPRVVEEPRWVRGSNAARVALTLTSY